MAFPSQQKCERCRYLLNCLPVPVTNFTISLMLDIFTLNLSMVSSTTMAQRLLIPSLALLN